MLIETGIGGATDFSKFDASAYTPPSKVTAPVSDGPSFLSGLFGAGGIASLLGGGVPGLGGMPGLSLSDETNQTVSVANKQNAPVQVSSPFQVGGKGNSLDNSPSLTASPVDSTNTAPTTGALGISKNALVVGVAIVAAFLLFIFTARRRS